jgi:hypothetical protein
MPYQFQGQRSNEEVLVICRQHPFSLLKRLIFAGLVLLFPLLVDVFIPVGGVLAGSIVICLVLGLGLLWHAWSLWWNTTFLLTTERIVLLEQFGMFNREFAEVPLGSIVQVSHDVKGILPTLLGFGSIRVAAGAARDALVLPNLPEPYGIQQEIQAAMAGERLD